MEIHTNKPRMEPEPAPDQSRYLRRKAPPQKLHKNRFLSRLLGLLRFFARLGAFVLLAAFLASIFVYAYYSDKFALRNVAFEGCKQVDTNRLEALIREKFPSNLLRINLDQLRILLEHETWIRRVEIRRVLPSNLIIQVQVRVPSVILDLRGELMLADDDGVLLDRYDPKYGKLDVPVFKGVLGDDANGYRLYQEENSERIRLGRQLLSDLDSGSPDYPKSISEVDLSEKNDIKVTLVDDTAEIHLGDRDFLKRFRTLLSNMTQYRELKAEYTEVAAVDLRFDGQIIYRPKRQPSGHNAAVAEAKP